MITKTMYGDNTTKAHTCKCWNIVKLMGRVFHRENRKERVGSETAYEASVTHMRTGHYLWHTIKSHRAMIEFIEADFHRNTSMSTIVANHLLEDIAAKVDVDVFKAKIW